eukprot:m.40286 g.40286  ORF g.40286 m.40286 type:complete len:585 (+) comp6916_c0_seq1:112-1866(+)
MFATVTSSNTREEFDDFPPTSSNSDVNQLDEDDVSVLYGFHDIFKQFMSHVQSGAVLFDALVELSSLFQNVLSERQGERDNSKDKLVQMRKAWDLAEIFFIRGDDISKRGGFALPYLLKWVSKHFKVAEKWRAQVLSQRDRFEENEHYWPVILRLACQGRMKEVSQMLLLHREFPTDEFVKTPLRTMEELARRMPFYNTGTAISDFSQRWESWKRHVVEWTSHFDEEPHLAFLARIFRGDQKAFEDLCSEQYALQWEEVLIANLLYSNPLVVLVNVGEAIKDFQQRTSSWDSRSHHAHNLHFHIIDHEPLQTLHTATELFGSHLFSSHLSFFLHQGNWLSKEEMDQPEKLTLSFGKEIAATHPNLFHLAATYLSFCGDEGIDHLHKSLLAVPLQSARSTCKVLSICRKYNLSDTANNVCCNYAMTLEGEARYSWLLKGHDYNTITKEIDELLSAYETDGEEVLDVVKPFRSTTQCERLAFAANYQHMLELRSKNFLADASTVIMRLLTASTITPKWFWIHVLKDALPLLENEEIFFSAEETRALIQCLEEVVVSHCFEVPEDDIAPIRMALARNLARTIILDQR